MKFTKTLIAAGLLLASSSSVFAAATDSTDIQINVTKDAYVNLIGTAVGSTNSFLTSDIDNATVSLGTLGLESNSQGNCELTFSSANGYQLKHNVSNAVLVDYAISYAGVTNSSAAANTVTQSCNTAASSLDLVSPALPAVVDAGTYSDTVTVTVVTQ